MFYFYLKSSARDFKKVPKTITKRVKVLIFNIIFNVALTNSIAIHWKN